MNNTIHPAPPGSTIQRITIRRFIVFAILTLAFLTLALPLLHAQTADPRKLADIVGDKDKLTTQRRGGKQKVISANRYAQCGEAEQVW